MKFKKTVALATAAGMVLSVTACGGNSTTPSTSATEAPKSAASSETVTVASSEKNDGLNLSGDTFHVGGQIRQTSLYLYYARDKGLFEDAGLNVEIETFSSGMTINEAFTAGELDMAANGMASVYILPTELFAYVGDATINEGGQEMFCRTDSDTAKAGKYGDTPYIGSPETVKGKTFLGLGGNTPQYNAIGYAEALGLAAEDIEFVNMDHASAYEAFISGQGDFLATTPPYSSILEADQAYTKVASLADVMGAPLMDSIVVTNDMLEKNHDDVIAFVDCCYEAMDMLVADPKARAEYAMNLYQTEGGVNYSEDDMTSELANVTYWTWDMLENPPYEFGTTMKQIGSFFMDQGLIEEGSMPAIEASLHREILDEVLAYHKSK